jgi:Vps16, N-terminal region
MNGVNDSHFLGEVLYRKWLCYDELKWTTAPKPSSSSSKDTATALSGTPFAFDEYQLCGAPFGGPLAMLSKTAYVSSASSSSASAGSTEPAKLYIFSSSGNKLAEIEWQNRKAAGMGWSDQEQLVIVLEDGKLTGKRVNGCREKDSFI